MLVKKGKMGNIILIFSIGVLIFNIVEYKDVKNIIINKAISKKEIIIVVVNTVVLLILLFYFHKYKPPAEELTEELIKINNKQKKKTNDNVKSAMAAVLVSGKEKSNC
jgi:predicted PurR-regulated permease PerM